MNILILWSCSWWLAHFYYYYFINSNPRACLCVCVRVCCGAVWPTKAVRIGSRGVETLHAAYLAKGVLGCVCVECVRGYVLWALKHMGEPVNKALPFLLKKQCSETVQIVQVCSRKIQQLLAFMDINISALFCTTVDEYKFNDCCKMVFLFL